MVALLVLAILLIDQWLKIWVKTNMSLHESIEIFSWFKISFIENNGMAFGMEIGSKIFLSVFRVVAVAGLSYYIWLQLKAPVTLLMNVLRLPLLLQLKQCHKPFFVLMYAEACLSRCSGHMHLYCSSAPFFTDVKGTFSFFRIISTLVNSMPVLLLSW